MISTYGYSELRGLSTDEKPINNIENGTVFFEMDTQKLYMFDAENKTWLLVAGE